MDVQENQVRAPVLRISCTASRPLRAGGNYIHFRKIPEQVGQLVASQLFVVDNDGRQSAGRALSHGVGIIAFRPAPAV